MKNILGSELQAMTYREQVKWAFEKEKKLKNVTRMQLEKYLEIMKIDSLKENEVIISNGEKIVNLYIILEGAICEV